VNKTALLTIALILGAAALTAQIVPNMPAPAFTLKDLNGKSISLADLRGKIIVLNFWATWCPPCREEIPDFVEFYNQNKATGLEIVGVSVDNIPAAQVQAFVNKNKMTYPVAMFTEKIVRDYGPIDAIPTTFIIDKTGRVRYTQVGMMGRDALARWYGKLAAEK
jgi:peroxiredoxin